MIEQQELVNLKTKCKHKLADKMTLEVDTSAKFEKKGYEGGNKSADSTFSAFSTPSRGAESGIQCIIVQLQLQPNKLDHVSSLIVIC